MSPPVRLRRATPADLAVLLEMNAQYCVDDGHDYVESVARAGIGPLLVDDTHGSIHLIVEDGPAEAVLGYAVLARSWSVEIGGAETVLDELFVRRDRRGEGIGGAALEALAAHGRSIGLKRIFLETERPNAGARRLYARHGFAEEDSIWMARSL